MWNKKTFTVLCSLALAGSMAVPAFAAEGICGQEALIAAPYASVVAEKPTVTAGEDLFTRAELVSALHQKAGSPVVNFAMQYTDVEQGRVCGGCSLGVQRKNRRRLWGGSVWSRGPGHPGADGTHSLPLCPEQRPGLYRGMGISFELFRRQPDQRICL